MNNSDFKCSHCHALIKLGEEYTFLRYNNKTYFLHSENNSYGMNDTCYITFLKERNL